MRFWACTHEEEGLGAPAEASSESASPSASTSSTAAAGHVTALVLAVGSPGGPAPGRVRGSRAGIAHRSLDDLGDRPRAAWCSRADRYEDDVDDGVFVDELLVVAGDLEPESPLRRNLLVNDKWRRLFDKFDPEGFGEIPWADFLAALEDPEFLHQVGPAKREILTAKAHRSHTSAITFDDFVAVVSQC
ncbi:hypothetical protein ISCGN_022737 [Ixodes scapularis]